MEKETEQKETEPVEYRLCGHCRGMFPVSTWLHDGEEGISAKCPDCGKLNHHLDQEQSIAEAITEAGIELTDEELPAFWRDFTVPFTKSQVDALDKVKKEMKGLKKKEEAAVSPVKNFLVANSIGECVFEGHTMVISYQDRGSMDEDKLVAVVKAFFTPEEIADRCLLKAIAEPEAVKQAIMDGTLPLNAVAACRIENLIPVFNLNSKRKKSDNKSATSGFGGMF